ncbi:PucR family transcriptional regulator [Olsenella porci]|uniref:PucR family transcriptional regulator n=1 Tax=Olsenella porci TaxID=2652279 RepID=A0A6N7XK13_9ACTN|nr:PucR family transcriptional regulator [Olsenella porci]MST71558.1 PucR family transcriptional regulator [Olsenella porci]
MIYTVSDFLNSYAESVRLIAGKGGLSRAIGQVGILDYELMPGLKTRYQRVNFEPDQLVLSTFLYARDDPWLIGEAIKYLVGRGVSGLVIKNVLHLEIPDSAVRYANARDFPLFVTSGDGFFFDTVIAQVDRRVTELADASFAQNELDIMTQDDTPPQRVREHALRLNPSFGEEHVVIYIAEPLSQAGFAQALSRYYESKLSGLRNLFAPYGEGLLYVTSGDSDAISNRGQVDDMVSVLRAGVLDHEVSASVGISETHFDLGEMDHAVLEARRSALVARRRGGGTVRYADLGVLRVLLPCADRPEMRDFASDVLEPLRSHDAETGSDLMGTLAAYCDAGCSIEGAARALDQHPNTVRYRLDKVAKVTGLSYKVREQMEQLSVAHKIELARKLLRE